LSFVSPLVKEKFSKKIEAIEEKATITLIPEETRTTNSYLKYAAIFVLGLGLAGSWPSNQIASETLLVETAVQNKFKIKFSRLLSLSKAQFLQ
jgi:5,10-methylene-tetrahydrofolate dehydrogenase/methenyl tetrahydrofolate cyclohydrolase